jgi:hypothetical protein
VPYVRLALLTNSGIPLGRSVHSYSYSGLNIVLGYFVRICKVLNVRPFPEVCSEREQTVASSRLLLVAAQKWHCGNCTVIIALW